MKGVKINMNKELIKSISTISEVYEDLKINGRKIPLILVGANGVFIFTNNETDIGADIELCTAVKEKFPSAINKVFLFRVDEFGSGEFYDSNRELYEEEDIYDAFENIYNYTTLAFTGVTKEQYAASHSM